MSTLHTLICVDRYAWLICVYCRHCACVYYHDWQRSKPARPANEGGILPAVSHEVTPNANTQAAVDPSRRNTLMSLSGVVVAVNDEVPRTPLPDATSPPPPPSGLPFDEEAKLVYGVVLSLRNMIKKISGK